MCFWYNEFKVEDFMEVNRNSSEYCIRFFTAICILHNTVMDSEDVKVHNAEGEKVIKSVKQGTIGSAREMGRLVRDTFGSYVRQNRNTNNKELHEM